MRQLSRESRVFGVENLLVVVMFVAAVCLQVMRRKKGETQAPLLLKVLESVTEALVI